MAEPVVLKVELTGAESVAAQMRAAGATESEVSAITRKPGIAAPSETVSKTKRTAEAKKDRIDVEREFNMRQGIANARADSFDRERDFNFRQQAAAAERAEKARTKPPKFLRAPPIQNQVPLSGGGGGRSRLSGAIRAGAASQAASVARIFGPGAASAAAVGGAQLAGLNPALAAVGLASVAAAAAVLTPAIIAATSAFREIELLGRVNADVALAQALRDRRQILGRIRRGERIGAEAAGFITEASRFEQAIKDAGAEILAELLPPINSLLQVGTLATQTVTPLIGPFFEKALLFFEATVAVYGSFVPGIKKIAEAMRVVVEAAERASEAADREDARAVQRAIESFDPANFDPDDPSGVERPGRFRGSIRRT